ncbi:hypothetical protein [Rhizobium halophytocola]|uniref:DM13 domain-containing protein n=1 Tax=Rhizobium halophytocola TaxID=735519 RepID=A0ABS4DTU9_9HYPH|nr:hypothetical protein [Rhizobium halophytocola]MBP1849123.1 hypothetical protein [Rhizobium halophytocola]
MLIATGTFSGRGGHILRGHFTLTQRADGVLMTTSEDFFFDGAEEPGWALFDRIPQSSADPSLAAAAETLGFGRLAPSSQFPHREIVGRRTALIPSRLSVDAYECIFLWCYATQFLLGIGPYALQSV